MKQFLVTTLLCAWLPMTASAGDCSKGVSEAQTLECNIYHEARGEGLLGMLAVAQVTLNRVDSELFPDTITQVVWAPGPQFSWTADGKTDRMREAERAEQAELAANLALVLHSSGLLDDVTGLSDDTMWFHAGSKRQKWTKRLDPIGRIGGHTFYEKS